MPLLPNFVERLILPKLNQGPGPLLDLFGAGAFHVVYSALELGIFDALSHGPLAVSELSQRTGTNERGMDILLAALEAFGYVQKSDNRYANTPLTAKWLLGSSPSHLADFLTWWQQFVFAFWDGYFEEAIRNDRPPLTIYEWLESQGEYSFAQEGSGCAHCERPCRYLRSDGRQGVWPYDAGGQQSDCARLFRPAWRADLHSSGSCRMAARGWVCRRQPEKPRRAPS